MLFSGNGDDVAGLVSGGFAAADPRGSAGAPAAIQAWMISFSMFDNGPVGDSSGGISPRRTSSQSSDSSGNDGTTISRLPAIRARSSTYPNRPLGLARFGP